MLGVGMFASKSPLPYGPILRISCLFLLNISCLRLACASLASEGVDACSVMLLKCLTIQYKSVIKSHGCKKVISTLLSCSS